VDRDQFEARVIELWSTTRVPLTRANLVLATGAPRTKMEKWLDKMVSDGIVELDSDDHGELLYNVLGATRPVNGPTSAGEVAKLAQLGREVKALARRPERPAALAATGPEKKSVVASGALSFFLGPAGWLYAAPLGEAVPALIVFTLLYKFLPGFLFFPLLAVLLPLSALAGAGYAWAYNQTGSRSSMKDMTKGLKGR
jgi:hypothetical protein